MYVNYKNMPAPQLILNAPALLADRIFCKMVFLYEDPRLGKDYVDGLKEGNLN